MSILGKIYIVVTAALILLSVYVMFFRAETSDSESQIHASKKSAQTRTATDNPESVELSTLPPDTPTDLTIEPTERRNALLQWYCTSNNVEEYLILSAIDEDEPFTEYATVPGSRTFYKIGKADLYDTRYFAVCAINAYGVSDDSEPIQHIGYYYSGGRAETWRFGGVMFLRLLLGMVIWVGLGFPLLGRNHRWRGFDI